MNPYSSTQLQDASATNDAGPSRRFRYRTIPVAFFGGVGCIAFFGSTLALAYISYMVLIPLDAPPLSDPRIHGPFMRLPFAMVGSALWMFAAYMIWRGSFRVGTLFAIAGGAVCQLPDRIFGPA